MTINTFPSLHTRAARLSRGSAAKTVSDPVMTRENSAALPAFVIPGLTAASAVGGVTALGGREPPLLERTPV